MKTVKTVKTVLVVMAMTAAFSAEANDIIAFERGTIYQVTGKDTTAFVGVTASKNIGGFGSHALIMQVHNLTGYDIADLKVNCQVHFDQEQRFLLQNGPTPPLSLKNVSLRNAREQNFVFWGDVKDYGSVNFYSNARIEHFDCQVASYDLHRESRHLFDTNTLVARFN